MQIPIPFPEIRIDLRWGSTATATAESATARIKSAYLIRIPLGSVYNGYGLQLRVELARGTTLFALLTATVTALTVATVATATAERSATLLFAEHTTGRSVRALLLDVGGGNDLGGEVEPLAQVIEAFGGQGVVVCSRIAISFSSIGLCQSSSADGV